MPRLLITTSLTALALSASLAQAAVISASDTGLVAPEVTIDFEAPALATSEAVTNQFAPQGVTFDPQVVYDDVVSARPNFSGAAVLSFFGADFSINFDEAVDEMSAAMTANFGTMTLTAYLGASMVESFTHTFPLGTVGTNTENFFGFSGVTFDRVAVDLAGSTSLAMDNLSFSYAPAIPLPAGLPLLLAGLGGLGLAARRKRAS